MTRPDEAMPDEITIYKSNFGELGKLLSFVEPLTPYIKAEYVRRDLVPSVSPCPSQNAESDKQTGLSITDCGQECRLKSLPAPPLTEGEE